MNTIYVGFFINFSRLVQFFRSVVTIRPIEDQITACLNRNPKKSHGVTRLYIDYSEELNDIFSAQSYRNSLLWSTTNKSHKMQEDKQD